MDDIPLSALAEGVPFAPPERYSFPGAEETRMEDNLPMVRIAALLARQQRGPSEMSGGGGGTQSRMPMPWVGRGATGRELAGGFGLENIPIGDSGLSLSPYIQHGQNPFYRMTTAGGDVNYPLALGGGTLNLGVGGNVTDSMGMPNVRPEGHAGVTFTKEF